jgi:outer membrane protein
MKKYSLTFIILGLSIGYLDAQSYLSADSAIAIVLKKNYNIIIAQNNYKQAENNHAPGVAGMLPNVGVFAGLSGADNYIHQDYSSGTTISKSGVGSITATPSLGVTWTLFDGTRMFIAYNQLGLLRDEGLLGVKMAMQDNIASVIEAYYNIVQQKQLLAVIDSNLSLYKEEMDLAQKQYEIGTGSKLNYLQAKVSYNAENSLYLKQQVNVSTAIVALNQVMDEPIEKTYTVSDSIVAGKKLIYDTLKKGMMTQNPNLALANANISIAENNLKEVNAMRLPSVILGINYGLSSTEANGGFTLVNQSLGLNGGLTFAWTLFNGNNINIQHKNAELNELNTKFQYDLLQVQTGAALLEAYQQYLVNVNILKLDEENFLVAKENVLVAIEQFRIGTSNIVQLQQAQISFSQAGSQVVSDRYNTKVSETQLLQLAGQLIK